MGWSLAFWIEFVFSFFLFLLMFLYFIRYRERMFLFMTLLLFIIFGKSLIYLAINLTNVEYVTVKTATGYVKDLNPIYAPLYYLRYFVFQSLELLYFIIFYHILTYSRKKAEERSIMGINTTTILQLVFLFIISGIVIYLSLSQGDRISFKTSLPFLENFKENYSNWFFMLWKMILIVFCFRTVRLVGGYAATQIRIIDQYRRLLYVIFSFEFTFNLFSILNYYKAPFWFVFQVVSVILISIFAYGVHSHFVYTFKERVESLNKEKDSIILLMKEISQVVGAGEFDLDTVVKAIVDNSVKGTNARGGVILLKDPITNRLSVKYVKGLYPPTKPIKMVQNITLTENIIVERLKSEKIAVGEGLLGKVAETGESIYIPDVNKDERFVQTVSDHILVTSFMAVPLKSRDNVFGVLSVVDDSKMFYDNDLSLLESLGEQAAITINQVQMYHEVLEKKQAERELGVAGEIQASLIPHSFPQSDRFEIYGFSIPAKGVGGDYYDYIDFGNNKVVLTMFDVSGKGVPAALIMVMIRSILRTVASLNEDTKDVVARLNNTIAGEIVEDRYATGFYLLFDAEKGIMSYTNAGHGPLILYRAATDDFEFLDTEGMPIGIMSGVEYGQNYTVMENGDIAVLYTDGINEAMNENHEEFGMERFKEVIRAYRKESARDICNRVLEAVTQFSGTAPQHDDETLLVLKNK